jgi:hypothetical protein
VVLGLDKGKLTIKRRSSTRTYDLKDAKIAMGTVRTNKFLFRVNHLRLAARSADAAGCLLRSHVLPFAGGVVSLSLLRFSPACVFSFRFSDSPPSRAERWVHLIELHAVHRSEQQEEDAVGYGDGSDNGSTTEIELDESLFDTDAQFNGQSIHRLQEADLKEIASGVFTTTPLAFFTRIWLDDSKFPVVYQKARGDPSRFPCRCG